MKNRYASRSNISEGKIRRLAGCFAAGLTALQAAMLSGLNRNTVNRFYRGLQEHILLDCESQRPLRGLVQGDESFFGARRIKGRLAMFKGLPQHTHLPPRPHRNRTAIQPSSCPQVQNRGSSNPRVHAQGLTSVNDGEAAPGLFGRLYRPFHNELDDLANRSTVNAGRSTGPLAAVGPVQRWLERDNDIGAALRERIADVN